MAEEGLFARLIKEFGNENHSELVKSKKPSEKLISDKKEGNEEDNKGIMQDEDRSTGAVKGIVYQKYLQAAGGKILGPIFIVLLLLGEAANGKFI
jgi:hypothetical protein